MRVLDIQQRDLIASAFESAVDEVVVEHWPALTQEPQIVSRIAQRLEDRLEGLELAGAQLSVVAQELPDRGPRSLERRVGADLLICISVLGNLSKGFLAQAKRRDTREHRDSRYAGQCEDMLRHTTAAYGWEFGPTGTRVFGARSIVKRGGYVSSPFPFGRRLSTVLRRVLDCKEGDENLGVSQALSRRGRVTQLLEQMGAQVAVDVHVEASDGRP